tara:strand:- start:1515 stop:1721 length:207 start_codon:yes stop_codon:yes gene_type:complete
MLIASFEKVGTENLPATIVVDKITGIRETVNPNLTEIDTIGGHTFTVHGEYAEIVNFIAELLNNNNEV